MSRTFKPGPRIPPERAEPIGNILFDQIRWSNAALARRTLVSFSTMYRWFRDRGIHVDDARRVADVLDERAAMMLEQARALRRYSNDAVDEWQRIANRSAVTTESVASEVRAYVEPEGAAEVAGSIGATDEPELHVVL